MQETIILGIETSCDETAAAIVADGRRILSNVVYSQIDLHRQFGGVVPEVASRKHIEKIALVVDQAYQEAGLSRRDVDAIAVTNAPGLIGALLVGLSFAKALAYGMDRPLVAVNHLFGHIYANFLEHGDIEFPALCLVVSGGHTSLVLLENPRRFKLIGETRDDAAGEAFDKIARFMGLGYPGGPAIQAAAEQGRPGIVQLPRVFIKRDDYEFSFSGLKTATMNLWNKLQRQGRQDVSAADIAAEFQASVVEVLVNKSIRAAVEYQARSVLMAGGVAANSALRRAMREESGRHALALYYPSPGLCTDNAAMIAAAGYELFQSGRLAGLNLNAYASEDFLAMQS